MERYLFPHKRYQCYFLRFIDDSLIINSVSRIFVSYSVTGLLLSIIWISISVATWPIWNAGCLTTVSGGLKRSPTLILVNPATLIVRCGFMFFKNLMQSVVIRSPVVNIASGFDLLLNSEVMASSISSAIIPP